jgi:uncharacterized phage protein gp47/JayE
MATIQPSADYSDRDLASIRPRFASLIRSVLPSWTDSQIANFGNVLKDLFAWSADIQSFALDGQAAEAFLPTATQRASLLKLAAITGYKPAGAVAASTVETFTGVGLTANVPIPAGTVVTNLDATRPVEFQTLSPIVLTPGTPTVSVAVEHSTSVSESFAATGQPNFSLQLGSTPYLDGSLSLTTAQGLFTEVASFVNSGPSDKVFVVKVDDNDRATVFFGDGVTAGTIPTGTISASFKTGGGAIGNVSAHSLQAIPTPMLDIHGGAANVTVDNANAATGGSDREGTEAIRRNIPTAITAPAVSVARKDFEIHALEVPGIAQALYVTANEDPDVPLATGNLYLLGPGATAPSLSQTDRVRRQFQDDEGKAPYPLMAAQALLCAVAPLVVVDIALIVYLRGHQTPGSTAAIRADLVAAIQRFFQSAIDFAYRLRVRQKLNGAPNPAGILVESDFIDAIHDVPGLRAIDPSPVGFTWAATRKVWNPVSAAFEPFYTNPVTFVTTPTWTLAPRRYDLPIDFSDGLGPPASANWPVCGTISITNGDTGSPL